VSKDTLSYYQIKRKVAMENNINDIWYTTTKNIINKLPTNVFGLKFFPSLEPHYSNDADGPYMNSHGCRPISDENLKVVTDIVLSMGDKLQSCMEIGVDHSNSKSLSKVLIETKPTNCFYLGIDLDDKSYLNNVDKNTFTLQCNSHDQSKVREFLSSKNIKKLDILFIDGWHSVNTTVNDWSYVDLLSDDGVVIVHDTNTHPGDIALCEAIDRDIFDVTRCCFGNDAGIAIIKFK